MCVCVCVCADTLCAVLARDTLGIRENRLFGAVVRWAEAECYRQQLTLTSENKQKVLGKALTLIRFPLMTVEEFAAGGLSTFLLWENEHHPSQHSSVQFIHMNIHEHFQIYIIVIICVMCQKT